jgi:hypothetical protein
LDSGDEIEPSLNTEGENGRQPAHRRTQNYA